MDLIFAIGIHSIVGELKRTVNALPFIRATVPEKGGKGSKGGKSALGFCITEK